MLNGSAGGEQRCRPSAAEEVDTLSECARPVDGYVSPFDERVRPRHSLAPRPASIAGRRLVLLDINKNRGAELLDRLESHFVQAGASVHRTTKEIFSKPASPEVIDDTLRRADAVVEALAD